MDVKDYYSRMVYHPDYGTLLLRDPGLGIGATEAEREAIIADISRAPGERGRETLVCQAVREGKPCRKETEEGNSPYMYIRRSGVGTGKEVLTACHLPLKSVMTAAESEKHLALKGHIGHHTKAAGQDTVFEDTTRGRGLRPDVTSSVPGRKPVANEVQLVNIPVSSGWYRSVKREDAGMVPNWFLPNASFHLEDRVNYVTFSSILTADQIGRMTDIVVLGGVRILLHWKCTPHAERECFDPKNCQGWHGSFVLPYEVDQRYTIGQTAVETTDGGLVPLRFRRSASTTGRTRLWVPNESYELLQSIRPDLVGEDEGCQDCEQQRELIFPGATDVDGDRQPGASRKRGKRPPKRNTSALHFTYDGQQDAPTEAVVAPVAVPGQSAEPDAVAAAVEPTPGLSVVVLADNGLDDEPTGFMILDDVTEAITDAAHDRIVSENEAGGRLYGPDDFRPMKSSFGARCAGIGCGKRTITRLRDGTPLHYHCRLPRAAG